MPKADVVSTQKIVVGVNGSAASDAALEWAIQEAESRGAEIIAVHVLKPIGAPGGTTVRDVRLREFDYLGDDVRSHVKKELFGPLTGTDIKHRIILVEGHPATGILHVADVEDADLIVVGNGQHSTMEDLFLGSVAHELSHKARRPFALIPSAMHAGAIDVTGRDQRTAHMPRQTWSHGTGDHIDEVAARALELIR
ncbi:MAG: universal stress protein [Candidatus Dormiibacterota bacterium]